MQPKVNKQKHPPERETLQVSKREFTIAKYACQIQAIGSLVIPVRLTLKRIPAKLFLDVKEYFNG